MRVSSPAPDHVEVPLRDGRVATIRPIAPSDAERLVRFHATLSDRSIYQRYFSAHPRLSEKEVARFTQVDHTHREAYIGVVDDEIIGVGRWDEVTSVSAEVAFLITDEFQGLGLGSVLFKLLAQAARGRGFNEFIDDFGESISKVNEEGTVFLSTRLPELGEGGLVASE